MNRRGRIVVRVAALLCAAGAATFAALGLPADNGAGASAAIVATPTARTPLLSPRRVPQLFADAAAHARLQRNLDAFAAQHNACLAVDDAEGTVARTRADVPLVPASNVKLLTASAALATLGPAYRFTTRALIDSAGNLVVIGGGDPVLTSRPAPADATVTSLADLATKIATNTRAVAAILVDDSLYDRQRLIPAWPPNYVRDGDIGSLGALTVDGGYVDQARRTAAADPAVLTGTRLADLLRARNVIVSGGVQQGATREIAREVARVTSPPLDEIVEEMLRDSNNYSAEMLARAVGLAHAQQGSTNAGAQAIVDVLRAQHVSTAGIQLHDGSGLATQDRVTCTTLLQALALRSKPPFTAIDKGLAVAGRSGTLTTLFRDDPLAGKLRAKTGSLTGVVALSGTIDSAAHPTFAFIANGSFSTAAGRALQVEVAHIVARYPDRRDVASLVPSP